MSMNKPFIKKLNIIPQEEEVHDLATSYDYVVPPATVNESSTYITTKTLKRLGRAMIVITSILFIIFAPLYIKDHVKLEILSDLIKNESPLSAWFISLIFIVVGIGLLVIVVIILILIYFELILPLFDWIME